MDRHGKHQLAFRATPEGYNLLNACAAQAGRSLSAELRLAVEFYALSVVLADLERPGRKDALGPEEWQRLRERVVADLADVTARATYRPEIVDVARDRLAKAREAAHN